MGAMHAQESAQVERRREIERDGQGGLAGGQLMYPVHPLHEEMAVRSAKSGQCLKGSSRGIEAYLPPSAFVCENALLHCATIFDGERKAKQRDVVKQT